MGNDLSLLQFQLTRGLPPASRAWQRLVEARLGHHGISSGCIGPLLLIGRSGGGLRQIHLAQQLGIESPSLVRLLDKLAVLGLVRREADAQDRRANQLWLTESGQLLHEQLEQDLTELRQDVFGPMSQAELEVVQKLYRLLDEALLDGRHSTRAASGS
jgi:MarR family transcriptional regulator for hemolysin